MVATGNELTELQHAAHHGSGCARRARRPRVARTHLGHREPPLRQPHQPARVAKCAPDPWARPARRRRHGDRNERARRGGDRRRRDPAVDRFAPAHPRVGHARRRARPRQPPGVPAARDPRASRRDRIRCHRRRVHAHVQRARRRGDARRVASAGVARQGSRGRGGARRRVPRAGRQAAEGRTRDERRPATATRSSSRATTVATPRARTRCSRSVSSRTATGSTARPPVSRSIDARLRAREPSLPDQRAAHLLGR